MRDARIVLPDASSPAAMAEAEAIGKSRRLYISKVDLMKHGLTEGCLGCRCRARLEAEVVKTEDGRARLTTAYLRGLPRDEGGGGPGACVAAPAALPVPLRSDEVQDEPMDAREASRERSAEDAGHEADDAGRGGAQPEVLVDEPAASWRIRIECKCGNGSAFGMGSGAASRPGQS